MFWGGGVEEPVVDLLVASKDGKWETLGSTVGRVIVNDIGCFLDLAEV